MDEVDVEIDVDDCDTASNEQFHRNDSQQTFNSFVHGLEKFEDLDAFLTQGDVRNVLEFGYDPFQSDRGLSDDPHILESTLDSILCVNEEEEVVGQGITENEEETIQEPLVSAIQSNPEVENKEQDVKKYNTRQRRRPINDSMYVYDSPGTNKHSLSASKSEKSKKKQELTSYRGRIKGKNRVLGDLTGSGDDVESDSCKDKTVEGDVPTQGQSFDERRLTRRQSRLTGVRPTNAVKPKQGKEQKVKTESDESERSHDESVGDDGSYDGGDGRSEEGSNASKEKQNTLRKLKPSSCKKEKSSKKHGESEDESYSFKDDDDDDDDDDSNDEEGVDDSDEDYVDEDESTQKTLKTRTSGKEIKNIVNKHIKQMKPDIDKNDDDDDSNQPPSGGSLEVNSKANVEKQITKLKVTHQGPGPLEKVGAATEANAVNVDSLRAKNILGNKSDRHGDSSERESRILNIVERKVREIAPGKKSEQEKDETKEGHESSSGAGSKGRSVSLASFVQSTVRKGGKCCKGLGCEMIIPPNQKSIYCGQACIDKYAQFALQILARERLRLGQQSTEHSNERVVVLERQTGKILTGPTAPTMQTLSAWLVRHPSFEVMLSPQLASEERKEKKIPEKRPLPASLRDNPGLLKDIKTMTAKLLSQKKEADDAAKTCAVVSSGASIQSKRPDPARISVRNVLREALTTRANSCDDVMVSANEIKSLVMDIEDELCKACEGVTAKYKYKVKAIITQIKDAANKGFFRRLLFGEVQPQQLVKMTNEKISSKEMAAWNDDVSALGILGSPESTLHSSLIENSKSPQCQPIFDVMSSATSETTSQHGTHFFDMNCKICTGKVPEPSYNLHSSSKTENSLSYSAKMTTAESAAITHPISSTHPSNQKPSMKTPLLPTPMASSPQDPFAPMSDNLSTKAGKEMVECKVDEILWTGTIFAKDITSVRINTHLVSGTLLSSASSGALKSLMHEDLPETIHMTGRLPPKNVFSFIDQLKNSGRLSKDVAVVYFKPANPSEDSFYQNLFSYLSSRDRCGVVSSGVKREVGRIKDLYIFPLPANTMLASVLLSIEGPGLPANRGNLLLGIVVKFPAKMQPTTSPKMGLEKSVSNTRLASSETTKVLTPEDVQAKVTKNVADDEDDVNDDEDDNKVIFECGKPSTPREVISKAPVAERTPKVDAASDEPYEPFDSKGTSIPLAATTKPPEIKCVPTMPANVVASIACRSPAATTAPTTTSTSVNASILASEGIAATMLSTLSAVTNSTSLKDQQRMLQELTHKINEQKIILHHQEQSMKRDSEVTSGSVPMSSSQQTSDKSLTSHGNAAATLSTVNSDTNVSSSSYSSSSLNSTPANRGEWHKLVEVSKITTPTAKTSSNALGVSSCVLASLPASINQLLSGETLKNLKNIMSSISTSKQAAQYPAVQAVKQTALPASSGQDRPLSGSGGGFVQSSSSSSSIDASTNNNAVDSKSDLKTNVHGDIDYRFKSSSITSFELPEHSKSSAFSHTPLPLVTGSSAEVDNNNFLMKKPALLATPPHSPAQPTATNKDQRSDVDKNDNKVSVADRGSAVDVLSRNEDKKDDGVWRPLLPKAAADNCGLRKEKSRRKGESKWRNDKRNRSTSRSRDFKRRKRQVSEGRQSDKQSSDQIESAVEAKDGDSDDVQIIKEEKGPSDVIEIDEEDVDVADDDKNNRSSKSSDVGRRSSLERLKTRYRSRERSRSQGRRRQRRSRSRTKRAGSSRKSRSRSPVKRPTTSKINPLNLPHNLPSLFPSMMQIVGGSALSKKAEPEPAAASSTSCAIPSLLDMLDPHILPAKYKKPENAGLLGSYADGRKYRPFPGSMENKFPKKGLLGDFPIQAATDGGCVDDVEDSVNKNLAILRRESEIIGSPNEGYVVEREKFDAQENARGPVSYPEVANVQRGVETWSAPRPRNDQRYDDLQGEDRRMGFNVGNGGKDRTLLPTPRIDGGASSTQPFPNPAEHWDRQNREGLPKGNLGHKLNSPPYNRGNFYGPGMGNSQPFATRLPLKMPCPRGVEESRTSARFSNSNRPEMQQRHHYQGGRRFQRSPYSRPLRPPRR